MDDTGDPHGTAGEEEEPDTDVFDEDGTEEAEEWAGEPDVLLDIPHLQVDEIALDVENLRARVSLRAEVLDLVKLHVGADVELGAVHLDIKGVEAQALLKVHLDNVTAVIGRVLTTIDRNPEILRDITSGVGPALEEAGTGVGRALDETGRGVGRAVDEAGRGVGRAVDEAGRGAGRAVADVGEGARSAAGDVGRAAGEVTGTAGDAAGAVADEGLTAADGALGADERDGGTDRDSRRRARDTRRTRSARRGDATRARRAEESGDADPPQRTHRPARRSRRTSGADEPT
ncbi:hypothetical protein ACFTXJ_18310 [Streptomyces zhihengii]|uniref:hypothetical protein n=1 Tax=Streptomyces zhihengii TaxID=1818004 RepID=UPI003631265F